MLGPDVGISYHYQTVTLLDQCRRPAANTGTTATTRARAAPPKAANRTQDRGHLERRVMPTLSGG
jgi:hypothetical protein